jgi:predicted nucleic acid-binding Zn ribbon protein
VITRKQKKLINHKHCKECGTAYVVEMLGFSPLMGNFHKFIQLQQRGFCDFRCEELYNIKHNNKKNTNK